MKCAILLHGLLGRSLTYTAPYFRKNIVEQFDQVDIFYHSWHTSEIHNPYAGEYHVSVSYPEIQKHFPGSVGVIEDQALFKITTPKSTPFDHFPGGGHVYKNYLRALESQQRAWAVFEKQKKKTYDAVIATRLDLRFGQPLSVPKVTKNTLWIPSFSSYGGVNDRFALGDEHSIKVWSHRLAFAKDWLKNHQDESTEWLLEQWLIKNKIKINELPFVFQLMRANGRVPACEYMMRNWYTYRYIDPTYQKMLPLLSNIKSKLQDIIE